MQVEKLNKDVSSIMLIAFVVITFITSISVAVIQSLVSNWCKVPTLSILLLCMQIVRILSYILPALAIKNKTYKVIGIILTSIMVVYLLFSPIMTILKLSSTT